MVTVTTQHLANMLYSGWVVVSPLFWALVVLVAGIFIGKTIGRVTRGVLNKIKIRDLLAAFSISPSLLGVDIVDATAIFLEFYTYFYFLLQALVILNLSALGGFVIELKVFILNLFKAFIIALIGASFARVTAIKVEESLKMPIVSEIVKWLIYYITAILALATVYPEASRLLQLIFLVILGGIGAGLAIGIGIAVGFGAKDVFSEFLKEKVKK